MVAWNRAVMGDAKQEPGVLLVDQMYNERKKKSWWVPGSAWAFGKMESPLTGMKRKTIGRQVLGEDWVFNARHVLFWTRAGCLSGSSGEQLDKWAAWWERAWAAFVHLEVLSRKFFLKLWHWMWSSNECQWHLEEFPGHRSGKEKEPAEDTKIGKKNREVQCPWKPSEEGAGTEEWPLWETQQWIRKYGLGLTIPLVTRWILVSLECQREKLDWNGFRERIGREKLFEEFLQTTLLGGFAIKGRGNRWNWKKGCFVFRNRKISMVSGGGNDFTAREKLTV